MLEHSWGISRVFCFVSFCLILPFNKCVHKEDIRASGEGVVHAKSIRVETSWHIREPNDLNCLEHEVVGRSEEMGSQ